LVGAPPPKPSQRFANANGICLLNKKGKKCSSPHNLPGTWEYNPDGKSVCTVECNLKPHATMKGVCINGKECLYKHTRRRVAEAEALL